MKSLLLTLVSAFCFLSVSMAQYCGNSDSTVCVATGNIPAGYYFTPSENIPCIVRGQPTDITIQFRQWYMNSILGYEELRIDTVDNLPAGLCWATNAINNEYEGGRTVGAIGCMRITGVTYSNPGQYRLKVWLTSDMIISSTSPEDAETEGVVICLRVVDASFVSCPTVDTGNHAPVEEYVQPRPDAALIKGTLYFDNNQNNVFDSTDQGVRNQMVSINGFLGLANDQGMYNAFLQPGNYTVTPVLSSAFSGFPVSPSSHTVNAATTGVSYDGNDFAIDAPPGLCDGDITIVGEYPPPRPGFTNSVRVRFTNNYSSAPVDPTLSFTYEAPQTFVNAVPSPATIDTANRTLTWNFTGIGTGTYREAEVMLRTPVIPPTYTYFDYTAQVPGSWCNGMQPIQTTEQMLLVYSCDPNDKIVSPVGAEPGGRVLPSSSFSYTVRFQNTGTFMAEIVRITDTISDYLDISTLSINAASHPYEVSISGRELTFLFPSINLPDSNSNEPLSHGFIKYSIKPNTLFVQGSVIQNRADIYFDFNEPIRTNTVENTADDFTGINEAGQAQSMFAIYPNPLSFGNWQLETDASMLGKELKIYDASGRNIFTQHISHTSMEIAASGFSQGIYLAKIESTIIRLVKL